MSDYLDNLVAKSLGLAEVALPRPLSLFEPLQPAGLPAPDLSTLEQDGALNDLSAGLEPAMNGATPSTPNAEPPETSHASHRATRSEDRESRIEDRGSRIEDRNLKSQISNPKSQIPTPQSQIPNPKSQILDPPAASEHSPLRVVLRAAAPADGQSTATQEAARLIPAHAAAPEQAPERVIESISPAAPSRTLLVAPAITPKPGTPKPGGDQKRESPLSDRVEPTPSAPGAEREITPTIKITIGRVDVRAVTPERPAPRPTPERRPALSLDDYLKQRSGGKAGGKS